MSGSWRGWRSPLGSPPGPSVAGRRAHPSSFEEGIVTGATLPVPLQISGSGSSPGVARCEICVQRLFSENGFAFPWCGAKKGIIIIQ